MTPFRELIDAPSIEWTEIDRHGKVVRDHEMITPLGCDEDSPLRARPLRIADGWLDCEGFSIPLDSRSIHHFRWLTMDHLFDGATIEYGNRIS